MSIDKKNGIEPKPIKGFIAATLIESMDNELEKIGVTRGIISFAIPNYGIQFRCRTEGALIDMEFAAFFSLLEFVTTKLNDENIKKIEVVSSFPLFVFSFTRQSDYLKNNKSYLKLISEFSKKLSISVSYIKAIKNEALKSPSLYPSMSDPSAINLNFSKQELNKKEFKPFQKGIKL